MKTVFLFLLFFALTSQALADDNVNEDELFIGFGDDTTIHQSQPSVEAFFGHLSGYAKLGATYNFVHHAPHHGETDWRGLSRLRAELQIEADYRLKDWKLFVSGKGFYDFAYAINGRSGYISQVLDEYEKEIELREAYLQGALTDSLDLKIGRQIVVWGRSDNFRVADILNPLDNREPGLTDIEDLRLPVVMTKLDYYTGNWNLGLIAIHEHRYDKNPPFGHDFYPETTQSPPENKPAHALENTEIAVELKGIFAGWDVSLYGARIYNDQPTFVPSAPVIQEHRRVTMAGAAMNVVRENFLYIFEAAHFRGLQFMNDYGTDYNRTDILAGIEYMGFAETTISFDIVNRHIHGFGKILEGSLESPKRNDGQVALRINRDFMNDTLALTALLVSFGERAQNGAFQRLTATYDISDGWSITGGVVFYQSGSGAMKNVGDNDRVFMEIRHDV
jgi:hypothetical protein